METIEITTQAQIRTLVAGKYELCIAAHTPNDVLWLPTTTSGAFEMLKVVKATWGKEYDDSPYRPDVYKMEATLNGSSAFLSVAATDF